MAVDPRRGAFRSRRRRYCALGHPLAVYREGYYPRAGSSVRPAGFHPHFLQDILSSGLYRRGHPLSPPPKRLSAVRVVGMRMVIPPKTPDGAPAIVPLNSGPGGKALAISKITADGVMLEFLSEDRGKKSYVLKIDRLGITDVGSGTGMSYRATLTNTEVPHPSQVRSPMTISIWAFSKASQARAMRADSSPGPWRGSRPTATSMSARFTWMAATTRSSSPPRSTLP